MERIQNFYLKQRLPSPTIGAKSFVAFFNNTLININTNFIIILCPFENSFISFYETTQTLLINTSLMENPHDVLRFVLRCCSGICSSLIHRYNNIGYVNPKNFATSLYTIYIFENFG